MKTQDLVKTLVPFAAGLGAILLVAALGMFLVTDNFDQKVLVLFAVGAALLLITAAYYPHELLNALKGRTARYGSNTVAMVVIFVIIMGLLNFLSVKRNYRWDLTESGDYSLSQQTAGVLAKLDEPVKVTAFYTPGGQERMEDLLKEYRRHSDRIDYKFVDPVAKPIEAREYKIQADGTTVLEYKGKRQDVYGASEQDLTSALLKLVRGKALKAYFLAGHGEANIDGADRDGAAGLKAAMEADNYEIAKLTLATAGAVPEDAAAVVIAGPQTPFLADEKKALKDYLDKGGKALIMLEPRGPDSLNEILSQWGVEVGNGAVIDVGSSLANQPQVPIVMRYGYSPITKDLLGLQQMTVLPLATSVSPAKQTPNGVSVSSLMESSERSWLETDAQMARFDEGIDTLGPLSLAVAVEGNASAGQANEQTRNARLVVIGNVVFATNDFVNEPAIGNKDFVLNSLSWLVEEEEMISVRAKEPSMRPLFLTGVQMNFVFYTSVIFLPLAILSIGGLVWWKRR